MEKWIKFKGNAGTERLANLSAISEIKMFKAMKRDDGGPIKDPMITIVFGDGHEERIFRAETDEDVKTMFENIQRTILVDQNMVLDIPRLAGDVRN